MRERKGLPSLPAVPCCVNVRPRAGVTVLPCPLGRFARPAAARRMHIRRRAAARRNSPQAGLGSLGFAPCRGRAWQHCRSRAGGCGLIARPRAQPADAPAPSIGNPRQSASSRNSAACRRSIAASCILPRLAAPGAHRARRLALRHALHPCPASRPRLGSPTLFLRHTPPAYPPSHKATADKRATPSIFEGSF